jgi:hypothetical protein
VDRHPRCGRCHARTLPSQQGDTRPRHARPLISDAGSYDRWPGRSEAAPNARHRTDLAIGRPGSGAPAARRLGALGTVLALHPGTRLADDTITVAFDAIGTIDLPHSYFDEHRTAGRRRPRDLGLDHAYAVTSFAVQGATRAVSTSRIDPTATRAEAYVDITRGQVANHLYLTRPADPLGGEALPAIPPLPIDDAVTRRLARSIGELTAWKLHQASTERTLRRDIEAIGF